MAGFHRRPNNRQQTASADSICTSQVACFLAEVVWLTCDWRRSQTGGQRPCAAQPARAAPQMTAVRRPGSGGPRSPVPPRAMHGTCQHQEAEASSQTGTPQDGAALQRACGQLLSLLLPAHQSNMVQLTSAGNWRARMRNLSPTGLKHSTTCRFLRTCKPTCGVNEFCFEAGAMRALNHGIQICHE